MDKLDAFFYPKSVALIGASMKPDSLGTAVMRNLLDGQFHGPILPVNGKYEAVQGVFCYPSVGKLPMSPELAILCTPLATCPSVLRQLAAQKVRAAILMADVGEQDQPLLQEIAATAREAGIRLLGPRSTGIQSPWAGLNASWISASASSGRIALVSQSGSLASGIVAWAQNHGIGFSSVISAGEALDIKLSEILDYLASDAKTRAVLLYLNEIQHARHFLSAARALSRIKPVIAIKSGHYGEQLALEPGYGVARPHRDRIYDAAFRRAGMLRVGDTDELFEAVSTLAHGKQLRGDRLAIVGNGGGPARIAADTLCDNGGRLAELTDASRETLAELAPRGVGNPLDLGRDATADAFARALAILLKDDNTDAVLVMYTPTAIAPAERVAQLTAQVAENSQRITLACWLGEVGHGAVGRHLERAQVPSYITPDKAARGFLHLVRYHRNQQLLQEIPASISVGSQDAQQLAAQQIGEALGRGEPRLDEQQSARILDAYGIPMPALRVVVDGTTLPHAADELGYPVALRLASGNQAVKSVGNMVLDINSATALSQAAEGLTATFRKLNPDTELPALVVQAMERRPDSLLLELGITQDALFGPIIHLGPGGKAVGLYGEQTVELPPLNMSLAQQMVERSRILQYAHKRFGSDFDSTPLCRVLVALSRLAADITEIRQLSINPLLVDRDGVIALDAQLSISPATQARDERLAIKPYPRELEHWTELKNGRRVFLRPIRPEDEQLIHELHQQMSKDDLRMRYCAATPELSRSQIAQILHIDYARQMTFIALDHDGAHPTPLGIVDASAAADNREAEFSVSVRTDMQGTGLGRKLLEHITAYCRDMQVGELYGLVLRDNDNMLGLARACGFRVLDMDDDDTVKVTQVLSPDKVVKRPIATGGYSADDFGYGI